MLAHVPAQGAAMNTINIIQTTVEFWKSQHAADIQDWSQDQLRSQAAAVAEEAQQEMEALAKVGLDHEAAWHEVMCSMVCKAPPEMAD
jgi:D-serine dehydratase